MKKIASILAMLVLAGAGIWIATLLSVPNNDSIGEGKPVVKIGAMFPLTGNMAESGESSSKALVKAFEDANANPANRLHYELLVDDDQADPRRAQVIMNKYFAIDKVNVISTFYSMPARVVAPEATRRQIVHFNCSYSDDILQSKYNFQNFISLKAEAQGIVDFLKAKKVESVSLFFENLGAADYLLNDLTAMLKETGIAYELDRFMPGERNFNISVGRLKRADTQALVVLSFNPELDIIAKEIRLNQIDKIVAFAGNIQMSQHVELFEGMYNIGSVDMPDDLRKHIGFKEDDNTAFATYLYDTGNIIVGAFEKAYNGKEIPSGEEIADTILSQRHYKGEVGDYTLDDNGQFNSRIETTVVKNGKFERVEE